MNPRIPLTMAVVAALSLACAAASAQTHRMRPGLWEIAMTMSGGEADAAMAQMQKEMAALPPDQRRMMEQMMAQRGMPAGAGQPMTTRVCVTQEQAEQDRFPQGDEQCRQESVQRQGNTLKFRFACGGNPPTRGEGEVTLDSPTAYSGRTVVTRSVQGRSERMEMKHSARFVGADCGNLRPPAR